MTTNQPQGTTHMERLRAALDAFDAAADSDALTALDRGRDLASRVRELLAEIEHIQNGGEPTDRMN